MPQPEYYVDWATEDEESVNGNPNKVDVPLEFQQSGLKEAEPLPRPYLNQQFNLIGLWVRYLEEQINEISISAGSAVIQAIFPVGSIYMTDLDSDPSDILGIGTWERIEGRFLVGKDTSDTDFDGTGETGGSKTHSHSESLSVGGHALTTDEIPSHTHDILLEYQGNNESDEGRAYTNLAEINIGAFEGTDTRTTEATGSSNSHSHSISGSIDSADNLPPYSVTNIWRRVA